MKRFDLLTLLSACVIGGALAAHATAASLEVPANGGNASGIGYFSGWKCPPNDNITIVLDGGAPVSVPSGVRRLDTAGVCGNDGRNGFIAQYNFGLLGDGAHPASVRRNGVQFASVRRNGVQFASVRRNGVQFASVRRNGVQFAQSTFTVTTFGVSFLTGASGTYILQNFPQAGRSTTVRWVQGAQNFVITDTTGGGGTTAEARFFNNLICGGAAFTSTLSANGFVWSAFSGFFSPYQTVNRTLLGPFTSSNGNCGSITYSFTLPVTPGRRHVLFQDFVGGSPVLAIEDEGPVGGPLGEGEAASLEDEAASLAEGAPTVSIPGEAIGGDAALGAAR